MDQYGGAEAGLRRGTQAVGRQGELASNPQMHCGCDKSQRFSSAGRLAARRFSPNTLGTDQVADSLSGNQLS